MRDGDDLETDSDDRQNSGQHWTVWRTAATQRRTALRTVMESADSADSDGRQDSGDTAATQRRTATTELRTVWRTAPRTTTAMSGYPRQLHYVDVALPKR